MKATGHHKVADDAGLPLLKAAFDPNNEGLQLGSFYMGNWLTDVAQAYDPVAGAAVRTKVNNAIDAVFNYVPTLFEKGSTAEELVNFTARLTGFTINTSKDELKANVKENVAMLFDVVMKQAPDPKHPPYQTSLWHEICRQSFFVKGFFKFVHPEMPEAEKDKPPPVLPMKVRMDMEVFNAIINTFYTQYWPHDHMDRPSVPVTESPVGYDVRRPPDNQPGIYDYMDEYTRVTAGYLTDLDKNWASAYLQRTNNIESLNSNVEFHKNLALLGKALHSVEDFFAHSNYIEHAARLMGPDYIPLHFQFDNKRFLKRLRRLTEPDMSDTWWNAPEEKHVVTGYFDFRDTFVSLTHLLEEGLMGKIGREPKDITREARSVLEGEHDPEYADNTAVKELDEIMHDAIELLTNPKLMITGKDNKFREAIYKEVGPGKGIEEATAKLAALKAALHHPDPDLTPFFPLFERIPIFQQVRQLRGANQLTDQHLTWLYAHVGRYMRYMSVPGLVLGLTVPVWHILKGATLFYLLPHKAIAEYLQDTAVAFVADRAVFAAKEYFFDLAAANRIGCHSLLGKDHGNEWLYQPMRNCAMTVHYYVMETLLRWKKQGNPPSGKEFVDWLELLRHFLRHPAAGETYTMVKPIPTTLMRQLTPEEQEVSVMDTLKQLAKEYAPKSFIPDGVTIFDDQEILRGNITEVLKKGMSKPNRDAMMDRAKSNLKVVGTGVKLGIRRIIVPYIRYDITVSSKRVTNKWFVQAMNKEWKVETLNTKALGHTVRFHPNGAAADAAIQASRQLKKVLEDRYQP